jgi:[NiFe] hydrogenase assembly HybE family chaperone
MMITHLTNPSKKLELHFRNIYENAMKSLDLCHKKLAVQAVGFQQWEGQWIGVMITPWFLNLMVLPKDETLWPDMKEGKGQALFLEFPYGVLTFEPRLDDELGKHLVCSLASPMDKFSDQAEVVAVAEEVLQMLKRIPTTELDSSAPANPERRALFSTGLSGLGDHGDVAVLAPPACSKR